jgi:hypothetical protein
MVRGGYAESEIIAEVQKRRLAAPIDGAVEKALLERGVPAALITRLKDRNFLPTESTRRCWRSSDLRLWRMKKPSRNSSSNAVRKPQLSPRPRRPATTS